jgi:hypothetical protein
MDIVFMKVFASWIFSLLKLLLDDVYIEETILKSYFQFIIINILPSTKGCGVYTDTKQP